jgi:hypothetical protein
MKKIKNAFKWPFIGLIWGAFYYFVGISRPAWFCCIMDHFITWAWSLGVILAACVIIFDKTKTTVKKAIREDRNA